MVVFRLLSFFLVFPCAQPRFRIRTKAYEKFVVNAGGAAATPGPLMCRKRREPEVGIWEASVAVRAPPTNQSEGVRWSAAEDAMAASARYAVPRRI